MAEPLCAPLPARQSGRRVGCWMVAGLLALAYCRSAFSIDYQVHGYAAQGFVLSSGNNFFGSSTDGSLDYYEAGLNAEVQVRSNLLFAAQGAVRAAGITDTGRPRLDYALMDYRFLPGVDAGANLNVNAGIRIGKVKNTVGFFNETRDVIFTRPSILLPSVYGDNQNQRNLVFTAPGVQLYGNLDWGNHEFSLVGTASSNRGVSKAEDRLLVTLTIPYSLRIEDSWNAQLMDSIDGGRWQLGVSAFYGRFILTAVVPTVPPEALFGSIGVGLDVLSARYNGENLSLTAEYAINPNKQSLILDGAPFQYSAITADTGYLQADYRLTSQWGVMARLDAAFRDRSDRDGHAYAAANPGVDPASRYAYDITIGVHWRYREHWGVWGEYHLIDGTATVQSLQNPGRSLTDHWSMLMLMAGYTF
jgi:hypothetical protein